MAGRRDGRTELSLRHHRRRRRRRLPARQLPETLEDRQGAAESLRLTRRIASMLALAKYEPKELNPGVEFQSDDKLAPGRRHRQTIFHPVGTLARGNTARR